MSHQLSKQLDLVAFTGSTGATSLTVEVDMANGAEGCMFNVVTLTTGTAATLTLSTAASTTASFVALSGMTAASTGGASTIVLDEHKPKKRWLKATATSTAAQPMFLQAFKYGVRVCPVTWSSTGILVAGVSSST
jgi:hypothetical protein